MFNCLTNEQKLLCLKYSGRTCSANSVVSNTTKALFECSALHVTRLFVDSSLTSVYVFWTNWATLSSPPFCPVPSAPPRPRFFSSVLLPVGLGGRTPLRAGDKAGADPAVSEIAEEGGKSGAKAGEARESWATWRVTCSAEGVGGVVPVSGDMRRGTEVDSEWEGNDVLKVVVVVVCIK